MRRAALVLALAAATIPVAAQEATLEYRVKAAYLFNFVRFVEWPPDEQATNGPLIICVAGRNPFGTVLEDTVRGERIGERAIEARVILEPDPACHTVFVPRGAATPAYLRVAHLRPVLTVGETEDFIAQGGIINFVLDQGKVRFEIDVAAAQRANLRISSRLLRLARPLP